MKIKELFKSTGVSQSFSGLTICLDKNNCKVANRTKNEDSVLLHLRRDKDGEEGQAYLRVQDEFKDVSAKLLNWAFISKDVIGLTLDQLDNLETNLEIEKVAGRIQLVNIG